MGTKFILQNTEIYAIEYQTNYTYCHWEPKFFSCELVPQNLDSIS